MKKRHKPFRRFLCSLLLAFLLVSPLAAAQPVNVEVNGQALPVSGQLADGVTFVPLRALLNALGSWSVQWEARSRTALATSGQQRIRAASGARNLTVNDTVYQTEAANYLSNDTLYIPLRLLCSALGASVSWDGSSRTARISSSSAASYSADELYWLSRIIYAESGAETLQGQIAVGNVVLNRVASPEFPNSVYGVIFDRQNGVQFEPVSNGTVYNTPSQQSVTAARMALDGANVVGRCLYFFNPSLSAGTWIAQNCSYYTTIGCHRFYL